MRVIVTMAELAGAVELIGVASAHLDGCLFHGYAGLCRAPDVGWRGRPSADYLNVASLDLLHPDRCRGDPQTVRAARRLMDAYVALGGRETWTCAPHQLPQRPAFGEHVAWAGSNAIVFANSVLGAHTGR
jgi:predicted aconitase